MTFISLPFGCKAEVIFTLNGEVVVNVYHFRRSDPILSSNLNGLAEAIISAWINNMQGACAAEMVLQRVICTDVSVEDGLQIENTTDLPAAGVGTNGTLPNNCALVVSLRSDLTGRSRRGRTYLAGFDRVNVEDNTPDPALVVSALAYMADIQTGAALEGWDFGVASYVSDGAPRTTALFTAFTNFSADAVMDSQRRRLPGRGI